MPHPDGIDDIIDAEGGMVLPSWCDSHTHIVYAGSREREFVDKINGLSYGGLHAVAVEYSIPPTSCTAPRRMNSSVRPCGGWMK